MRSSARFPEIPGLHRSTSSPTSRATRAGPGSQCRCRRNPRWAGSEDFACFRPAYRRSSGRKRRRMQAIEISSDGGRSWSSPGWPSRLSACTTSELVGLGSNSMVAVDQMGPYPLMSSSDGGSSWEDVALPLLPGADADPGNVQGSLQILPDGRLLLAGYRWYLLGSGATAWCSVTGR